jgi:hypothetical protein
MWRQLNLGLWANPKEVLATLGGVAATSGGGREL